MTTYSRLSALDRSFLDIENRNTHMHVGATCVFDVGPLRGPDGGIDIDRVRSYVESRLHLIPRYRQHIARIPLEGHPVWVDDEQFDIRYHVRHLSIPRPGCDRELKRLAGWINSQQLDRGKPLWEMWVVEGLEHDKRCRRGSIMQPRLLRRTASRARHNDSRLRPPSPKKSLPTRRPPRSVRRNEL